MSSRWPCRAWAVRMRSPCSWAAFSSASCYPSDGVLLSFLPQNHCSCTPDPPISSFWSGEAFQALCSTTSVMFLWLAAHALMECECVRNMAEMLKWSHSDLEKAPPPWVCFTAQRTLWPVKENSVFSSEQLVNIMFRPTARAFRGALSVPRPSAFGQEELLYPHIPQGEAAGPPGAVRVLQLPLTSIQTLGAPASVLCHEASAVVALWACCLGPFRAWWCPLLTRPQLSGLTDPPHFSHILPVVTWPSQWAPEEGPLLPALHPSLSLTKWEPLGAPTPRASRDIQGHRVQPSLSFNIPHCHFYLLGLSPGGPDAVRGVSGIPNGPALVPARASAFPSCPSEFLSVSTPSLS